MAREKGNHPLFDWKEVQWGGVITLSDGSHHDVVEVTGGYITMRSENGDMWATHKSNSRFWNARYVE